MKKISLNEFTKDRNNNLNVLRFLAAVLVVYCHAYPLGNGGIDILGRITDGQIHFGNLAVCMFFFYGGFLISGSAQRSKNTYTFFKARCIRIFPCLIVVVFLSAFVLGSCVTEYKITEYFSNTQTYEYLLNVIFVLHHNLPGVFEHNLLQGTVNGSLWTLPVEFLCYIVCWCVCRMGLLKEKRLEYTIPVFMIGYVCLFCAFSNIALLGAALRPCGMFYMGMLYHTFQKHIKMKGIYVGLCCAGLIVSAALRILEYGILLFLPYVLIWLAFGTKRKWSDFGKNYELSYGMYLCAFPIQQTVTMMSGGSMHPLFNFLISMPFILLCGFLLNVSVEKPLLRITSAWQAQK